MHFVRECINKTIKNLNICHKQIQEERNTLKLCVASRNGVAA